MLSNLCSYTSNTVHRSGLRWHPGPVDEPVAESVVARPAPSLAGLVDRYVGYRLDGFPPGTHQALPSGRLTLVVSLGPPVDLAVMPGRHQSPGTFTALAGGLHASPGTIVHDGRQHGVHVELTPLGARAVLGLPAGALAATVVDLGDLLGRDAAELAERMALSPSWAACFAVLDDVLARRRDAAPDPQPELAQAWRRLEATGGAVPVGALAEEVGWSRRHLAERFRTELGLAPKVAARVLRFDRARRLLTRPGGAPLAAVAATAGYYDQAHLTREWRELAGCSPAAWLAAEQLPSVQDGDGDAG